MKEILLAEYKLLGCKMELLKFIKNNIIQREKLMVSLNIDNLANKYEEVMKLENERKQAYEMLKLCDDKIKEMDIIIKAYMEQN